MGPGPGNATRDLLAHGAQVHAVEIGPALAETLRATLPSDQLTVEVGDFEEVPVDATAFDCVVAASAYHWITPRAQLDRPAVLLKPDGVLAVVDLIQVDSSNDRGFFAAAQPIYARHGQGHSGPPAPPRDVVEPPIRLALNDDDRFTTARVFRYDWDQTYTGAEYRLLMESYSVTQMMPPNERRALLDDIESFVGDQFDNEVVRPLVVTLTTARVAISTERYSGATSHLVALGGDGPSPSRHRPRGRRAQSGDRQLPSARPRRCREPPAPCPSSTPSRW